MDRQYIDPEELALAIQDQAVQHPLDFRTRLLIRDSLQALRRQWGSDRVRTWLCHSPAARQLATIESEDLGPPGFPFLAEQLMEPTHPDTIRQFLRELSLHVQKPTPLYIGGSSALILPSYLSRPTQSLDIVGEIPPEIRSQYQILDELSQRYRLQLTHFQSHYLPTGWQERLHSLEPLGKLQVSLVDVYDIFLSKLFSAREKDRDDLRQLAPRLDRPTLIRRLCDTTAALRADVQLRTQAEKNWFILYGERLPP
ncbi:MAG: DUF6036 family nucleotidyltransferase [Gemmataceae bacterium]